MVVQFLYSENTFLSIFIFFRKGATLQKVCCVWLACSDLFTATVSTVRDVALFSGNLIDWVSSYLEFYRKAFFRNFRDWETFCVDSFRLPKYLVQFQAQWL